MHNYFLLQIKRKYFNVYGSIIFLCLCIGIFLLFYAHHKLNFFVIHKSEFHIFSISFIFIILINLLVRILLHYPKELKFLKNLKSWEHRYAMQMIIICLVIAYFTYAESIFDKSLFVWKRYGIIILSVFFYEYLKQKNGYSDAEILTSQNFDESIGTYWAHLAYASYYHIVLESIRNRIASFEIEYDVKLLIKKLIIIIPSSGAVNNTLSGKDEKIAYFKDLPHIQCDQGAAINRTYKNPVYKILCKETIYVATECPNSLLILWDSKHIMKPHIFEYHRDCFTKTLKSLVEGSPCIILEYKDTIETPEPLHKCLLSALMERENILINIES